MVVLTLLMGGCSAKKVTEEADSRPKVIVGCDDYTPFSYTDVNGNTEGIDVELAKEAFGRMGYQAEIQFINWENKKQLLNDGQIDCIWSSFTMNGRENEYRWAGPYMKSNQVIAVRNDSDISALKDLEGKTIVVQSTTKPEDLFRQSGAHIPQFRDVISVNSREQIYMFLSKGYADAIAAHDTSVEQFMDDFGLSYHILEEPLMKVDLGVAFDLNDDRGLDAQLSEVLDEMQADGTVKEVIGRYLLNADKYQEDKSVSE